jgi:hypothetical protein
MSNTEQSSEPVPSETKLSVLTERCLGMEYSEIATRNGMSISTARRICFRAMRRGEVTALQIGYRRQKRAPRKPDETYDDRWLERTFARCVQNENGCWIWQGPVAAKGYGLTNYRSKPTSAHRTVFKVFYQKSLTSEQFVCHTCDTPACVNPMHLVLGDNSFNMADKTRKGRHHEQSVTHCPRGHEYNAQNTYRPPSNPNARGCKVCSRIRQRINSGWSEQEALSVGPIPPNQRTQRRKFFAKQSAA